MIRALCWICLLTLVPAFVESAHTQGSIGELAGLPSTPVTGTVFSIPNLGVSVSVDPVIYRVGWMEHPRGLTFSNELPTLLGGITNVRQMPLRGRWYDRSISAVFADRLRLTLSCAWLGSCKADGSIVSSIGRTADFEGDGTESWYGQGMVEWNCYGPLKLLTGFRWDHISSRLHVTRAPTGYDDFIVNGYMPLIGLRVIEGSPSDGIELKVLGFPFVPGDIRFHTWAEASQYSQESFQKFTQGHYVEILAEYRKRIFNTDLRIFGRWDLLHASTNVERALVPAPVLDIKWTFDRRSWTIGLGMAYDFNLL